LKKPSIYPLGKTPSAPSDSRYPSPILVAMTTRAGSASISLMKIVNWDETSQDINQALIAAFDAKDYDECIEDLRARSIKPLSYINSLDKVGS